MGGVALLECYPSARTKLFEWVRLRRDSELMALNLLSVSIGSPSSLHGHVDSKSAA